MFPKQLFAIHIKCLETNVITLVWFYGTSTILGYLIQNPFLYIYKYSFLYTK